MNYLSSYLGAGLEEGEFKPGCGSPETCWGKKAEGPTIQYTDFHLLVLSSGQPLICTVFRL